MQASLLITHPLVRDIDILMQFHQAMKWIMVLVLERMIPVESFHQDTVGLKRHWLMREFARYVSDIVVLRGYIHDGLFTHAPPIHSSIIFRCGETVFHGGVG